MGTLDGKLVALDKTGQLVAGDQAARLRAVGFTGAPLLGTGVINARRR